MRPLFLGRSDIDIWILVEDGDQLLQARRAATDIASDLADKRFTPPDEPAGTGTQHRGDRYGFEVLVESVETATSYDEAIADLLAEGIAIVDSEALQDVKAAVFDRQ